jgi:hypothetical protein
MPIRLNPVTRQRSAKSNNARNPATGREANVRAGVRVARSALSQPEGADRTRAAANKQSPSLAQEGEPLEAYWRARYRTH